MQVTQAIQVFLKARCLPQNADLVARWNPALETQVNVAAGAGEPVEGKRTTYSDGINEWHNIRLPKNANGVNGEPDWTDYELRFPFELHAEGIGCTGWDWKARRSRWVAFDFDSITAHAKGIGVTDEELEKIKQVAKALPYVESRQSTGGTGIHLYVYFDDAGVPTSNHTEHAALARCILGMMSAETGFDFASQIDVCGGIMWFWHRKMKTENGGLGIIKPASKRLSVAELPINWRDHIEVVQKKRSKVRVNAVDEDSLDSWEALANSRNKIPLDDKHKAQIDEFKRTNHTTLWITDHHLLQTHTCALARTMEEPTRTELKLTGIFKTNSNGNNPGSPNCFLFPLPNGAWKVYRFSQGVNEAETWSQDGNGWTTCYYNRAPDLSVASKVHGGAEDPDKVGEFIFDKASDASEAASALGAKIDLLDDLMDREARLKTTKDGRLVAEIKKEDSDEKMPGWVAKKDKWVRVFDTKAKDGKDDELGANDHDNLIREIMSPSKEYAGWMICKKGVWYRENASHVKMRLQSLGKGKPEAENIMGESVDRSWTLVNMPFHQEYPGGRQWNLDAAQLKFQPIVLGDDESPQHPHWDKILNHIGKTLDVKLRDLPWAQRAGIKTGAQYLTAWIACMIRYPYSKVPYLFMYGPENSGKSIFHEATGRILITKGYTAADRALTNSSNFNGELANCILAYVEEVDVAKSKGALERIKDWVTSLSIAIRKMRTDQYSQANTTHWVQCANKSEMCPVFPGDSRITVLLVDEIPKDEEIPKELLLELLEAEAPHFMYTLMNCELPEPKGRLRIPVVVTDEKIAVQEENNSNFPWADENFGILEEGQHDLPPAKRLVKADVYDEYDKAFPGKLSSDQFYRKMSKWATTKHADLGSGYGPKIPGVETRTWCYTRLYRVDRSEDNKIVAADMIGGQQ